MKRIFVSSALAALLGACTTPIAGPTVPEAGPVSAKAAMDLYYASIPDTALPVAPAGVALPDDGQVISRILLGSCNDEEKESAVLAQIARQEADLFLMVGDNVYGDLDGKAYVNNDPDLGELRAAFEELSGRAEFQAVRAALPMMVAWDDHDYGVNDGGGAFVFRTLAERIHERFWGLQDEEAGQHEGTYYAKSFGPDGQRVQIIMLDTRSFRSELTPTDAWGQTGKERYVPAADSTPQEMLGAAQWQWLEDQLRAPADIRLIASSIQILPSVHGWESWDKLPAERDRLFETIDKSGATGVVFLSGDRHVAFLYEDDRVLDYKAAELTTSSMNVSFIKTSSEQDARQVGAGFPLENFGAVEIDWAGQSVTLNILDADGAVVRENRVDFAAIGVD